MKKPLNIEGISKKYLRLAAVYRRFLHKDSHYDWSLESLIECYNHETHGGPHSKMNGYVQGKWARDLSVSMWREDIAKGDFCKAEFITPFNKWWTESALSSVSVPWFPYSNELDVNGNKFNQFVKDKMRR